MNADAMRILRWIFAVLLVIGAALLGLLLWSDRGRDKLIARHAELQQDVAREIGQWAMVARDNPPHETSPAAHQLEGVAEKLGINLIPAIENPAIAKPAPGRDSIHSSPATPEVRAASEFLDETLKRTDSAIPTPSPLLASYFSNREAELDEVTSILLGDQPVTWKSNLALGASAPVPNLLGIIRLERVLDAESLVEASRDSTRAERILEASWRLNESVRSRPEEISQLIAAADSRYHAGVLRHLSFSDEHWRGRLPLLDYRRTYLAAMELSSLSSIHEWETMWNVQDRTPLVRLIVGSEESVLSSFRSMKRYAQGPISDGVIPAAIINSGKSRPGDNNFLAAIATPNLWESWKRMDHATCDLELTEKILLAQELRQNNKGRWPETIPGIESTCFPGEKWIYSVTPDGEMSIRFSKNLSWPGQDTRFIPSEFHSN